MTDDTGLIAGLIRKAGPAHRKQLYAAPDVCRALQALVEGDWRDVSPDVPARVALGISVIMMDHYGHGRWKLIQHDHCSQIGGETIDQAMIITHERCTVLGSNDGPGTGELADYDPGTGRSGRDDWGRD
jgi:hypothetical protein